MKITYLKLKAVKSHDPKLRKNFNITFKADGVTLNGEISLNKDDGSIKSNIGKWYISAEIGEYASGVKGHGAGDCLACKNDLAPALLAVVKPLFEKDGFKLASGGCHEDRGWWMFMHHIPNIGEYKTVGTSKRSPEVVAIYLEAPALCPIHGKVKTEDADVMD